MDDARWALGPAIQASPRDPSGLWTQETALTPKEVRDDLFWRQICTTRAGIPQIPSSTMVQIHAAFIGTDKASNKSRRFQIH